MLNKICTAVIDNYGADGGLLVNYRELPGAIWTRILPHFGVACSDDERAATDLVRASAERQLGEVFRRLEDLRASGEAR